MRNFQSRFGIRYAALISAAIGMLIVGWSSPPKTGASASTLYVGFNAPGKGSCRAPDFSADGVDDDVAIQSAVNEAMENAAIRKIRICAGTYMLEAPIEFPRDRRGIELVGDGIEVTTLDGQEEHRIIVASADAIDPAEKISIRGMTLRNGWTDWFGGAIFFNGYLSLNRVSMVNNEADQGGSAIDNDGVSVDQLEIISSLISNNVSDGQGGEGGAINVNGGTVRVHRSVFDLNGNNRTVYGGALNAADVSISNSAFEENSIGLGAGGALYVTNSLTIRSSRFRGNDTLDSDGGAIYVTGPTHIEKTDFLDNSAGGLGSGDYGGAVMFDAPAHDLTLARVTFSGNHADGDGGAIAFYGRDLTINKGQFVTNTTGESGGAIYVYNAQSVSIDRSRFGDPRNPAKGNSAELNGGDIAITTGIAPDVLTSMRLTNSSLHHANAGEVGGSLFLDCTEAVLEQVTIADASSGSHGAGLFAGADVCATEYYVEISRGRFTGNSNDDQGGAIASEQGAVDAFLGFKVYDSYFGRNEAGSGAAINVDSRRLEVYASTFDSNSVTGDGGAIEMCDSTLIVRSARFIDNFAPNSAGAIMQSCSGTLDIRSSRFLSNEAGSNYGAIGFGNASSVSAILTRNNFSGNLAGESGGAIGAFFPDEESDVVWIDSWEGNVFRNNQAIAVGGDHVWFDYDDDLDQSAPDTLLELFTRRGGIVAPQEGWLSQS